MKRKKKDVSWAELLGGGLAHAQHAVDSAVRWSFRKMREAGRPSGPESRVHRHPVLKTAKKAGKTVLGFLGEVGDSFYGKYGELKSGRTKKKSEKKR